MLPFGLFQLHSVFRDLNPGAAVHQMKGKIHQNVNEFHESWEGAQVPERNEIRTGSAGQRFDPRSIGTSC
jgi:hypothetical protein